MKDLQVGNDYFSLLLSKWSIRFAKKLFFKIYSRLRNRRRPYVYQFCIFFQALWPYDKVHKGHLSGGFWAGPAQSKVVKMKKKNSYWASSTPWGHVLSLKTFCRNPVLSWAIRYSVFQKVKSTSSLEFVCDDLFSTFWHLMVKFG